MTVPILLEALAEAGFTPFLRDGQPRLFVRHVGARLTDELKSLLAEFREPLIEALKSGPLIWPEPPGAVREEESSWPPGPVPQVAEKACVLGIRPILKAPKVQTKTLY